MNFKITESIMNIKVKINTGQIITDWITRKTKSTDTSPIRLIVQTEKHRKFEKYKNGKRDSKNMNPHKKVGQTS